MNNLRYLIPITLLLIGIGCTEIVKSSSTLQIDEQFSGSLPPKARPNNVAAAKASQELSKLPSAQYRGKYYQHRSFRELERYSQKMRRHTIAQIAKKLGVLYIDDNSIAIHYEDWSAQGQEKCYRITQYAVNGVLRWKITVILEYFINNERNMHLWLPQIFFEAILLQKYQRDLPEWLQLGLICYGAEHDELFVRDFVARFLENGRLPEEVIRGVATNDLLFPKLEGYMLLRYFQQQYGTAVLKKFVTAVLEKGKSWERQLQALSGSTFFQLQERARNFAIGHIGGRYRPEIITYRKALRGYLQKNYLQAIPQLKKLSLRYPNSFMSGNLNFWLGMSYYRLHRYYAALNYFRQAIGKFVYSCTHLAEAHYYYALALYQQQQTNQAIAVIDNFIRDFPYHNLCPSAYLVLANCLQQKSQMRRAYASYRSFMEQFPKHHRMHQALMAAATIGHQLNWLAVAKAHFADLLDHRQLNDSEKATAEKLLRQIEWTEKTGPSASLIEAMDKLVADFSGKSLLRQCEICKELGRIGKLAFPWFERLLATVSEDCMPCLLKALSTTREASSIPLFLQILRNMPQLSMQILREACQLDIAPSFVRATIMSELPDLPTNLQPQIKRNLQRVLWNVPDDIFAKFPDSIRLLNGSSHDQLRFIEKMAIELGQEQVPILQCLVLYADYEQVKLQALQNLCGWQDATTVPILEQLVDASSTNMRILALRCLAKMGEYPLTKLQQTIINDKIAVRLATIDIVATANNPSVRKLLLTALKDKNFAIRNRAKYHLLQLPREQLLPMLSNAFVIENQETYFYMGIVEIMEKKTHKRIAYTPGMSPEQRKQLIANFK